MEGVTYSDYCEAGKPYGKQGYVRWLHERYSQRIAELEERENHLNDIVDKQAALLDRADEAIRAAARKEK